MLGFVWFWVVFLIVSAYLRDLCSDYTHSFWTQHQIAIDKLCTTVALPVIACKVYFPFVWEVAFELRASSDPERVSDFSLIGGEDVILLHLFKGFTCWLAFIFQSQASHLCRCRWRQGANWHVALHLGSALPRGRKEIQVVFLQLSSSGRKTSWASGLFSRLQDHQYFPWNWESVHSIKSCFLSKIETTEQGTPTFQYSICMYWIFSYHFLTVGLYLGFSGNELGLSLIKTAYSSLHRHNTGLLQEPRRGPSLQERREQTFSQSNQSCGTDGYSN